MKRQRRAVEVFSLSALDLFASGLGAFILLAMMLLPYYNKVRSMQEKAAQAAQQVQVSEQATRAANEAEKQAKAAEERALRMRADIQDTQQKIAQAQAAFDKGRGELEALKRQVDAAVKFVFLGIGTKKKSFIILVDMSGSMRQYVPIALQTIDRIVGAMGSQHKVTVMAFQHSQRDPSVTTFPTGTDMLAMTLENRRKVTEHARTLSRSFAGTTPTYHGLKAALEHPGECILLLSDGAPFYPRDFGFSKSPRDIVSEITLLNAGRKEIHTVALGDYSAEPGLVEFLQSLSRANSGGFAAISN